MFQKLVNYVKESKAELKKVAWPSRREAMHHTILVIGISLGVAAFLGAIDYILTIGFERVIER